MFIAALFTITRVWKQPKCLAMSKEGMVYMFSHYKKEWNLAIYNNMAEP